MDNCNVDTQRDEPHQADKVSHIKAEVAMEALDISIIIVSYNAANYLNSCLAALFKTQSTVTYEVIVIDNNSSDNSCSLVKDAYPSAKIICNAENVGFSKANNQGIEIAKGRYILLLNNDTEIIGDCLKKILNIMETNGDIGILGCKVLNSDGTTQLNYYRFPSIITEIGFYCFEIIKEYLNPFRFLKSYGPVNKFEVVDVPWVSGCIMCIRRNVFDLIGKFDEKYFLYYEDADLCHRLQKTDTMTVKYTDAATIYHHHYKSAKPNTYTSLLHSYRSSIYFIHKVYGMRQSRYYTKTCRLFWRINRSLLCLSSYLSQSKKIDQKMNMLTILLETFE